eukprot:scaffold136213_cov24-Tisochrysis_lutea.AAC.1
MDNLYVANCAMAGQQQGIQSDMPVGVRGALEWVHEVLQNGCTSCFGVLSAGRAGPPYQSMMMFLLWSKYAACAGVQWQARRWMAHYTYELPAHPCAVWAAGCICAAPSGRQVRLLTGCCYELHTESAHSFCPASMHRSGFFMFAPLFGKTSIAFGTHGPESVKFLAYNQAIHTRAH